MPYYPVQQQQGPGMVTKVGLSAIRITGCLTVVLSFGIGFLGCIAGGNIVLMVIGCGIALVGALMAAVNKVS
jgi:hypothetical protein